MYYKTAIPSSATPSQLHQKTMEGAKLKSVFKSKDLDESKSTYTFVGTKEVMDRDGDIVMMDGIDFDNFNRNPIVLWGHDSREMPIGKVVAVYQDVKKKETLFDIQFASTAKGQEVETLVAEGILKATSIGFLVKEYDYDEELNAFKMTEIEIFEISVCNVPANQDALLVEESEKSIGTKDLDIEALAQQVAELLKQEKPAEEPKEETGTETQEPEEEPATEPTEPDTGEKDEGEAEVEDEVDEEKPESDKSDLKIVAELLAELVNQLGNKGSEEETHEETAEPEPSQEDEGEEAEQSSEETNSSEEDGDNQNHSEEKEPEEPAEVVEIDDLEDEITYVLED